MRLNHVKCALIVLTLAPLALAESFYITPHLQNVSPDGATVIWETDQAGPGAVEYGLDGSYDQKAESGSSDRIRKVRVSGLKPDTTYSYRVTVDGDAFTSTLKTAPAPDVNREASFVVFGDTRRWGKAAEETKIFEHMRQWNPEFYIINGDLVGSGHQYEQWKEHFERFGPVCADQMVISARGNHEGSMLNDVENDWFAKYHDLPGGEPYSFFDWGNTHVVVLSWEQTAVPSNIPTTAQWLDEHLAGVKARYTFVTQHFPIYCTGYEGATDNRKQPGADMAPIRRVLDKHNVTAHMSGHTHIYERHYPLRDDKRDDRNGVHYLVNGGDIGGNYPDWWTATSDYGTPYSQPTYTSYQCKNDRMDIRTFVWSPEAKQFVQLDHDVVWKDEAVPSAVLASLSSAQGDARIAAIEELGAMLYAPAAKAMLPYLNESDSNLRRAAAKSIALIGNADVLPELAAYLADGDLEVRRSVARAYEVSMPEGLAADAAKVAQDGAQDEIVRMRLIGALQFHAPAEIAHEATLAVIRSDAPEAVRNRASYAFTRVATKRDVKALTKLFEDEDNQYVALRLAFTLNQLTGVQQGLDGKGALARSEPGKRDEFVKKWLKG